MRYTVVLTAMWLLTCTPGLAAATTAGDTGNPLWSVVLTDPSSAQLEVGASVKGDTTVITAVFSESYGKIGSVSVAIAPNGDGTSSVQLDTASEHHVFHVRNWDGCSEPPIPDPGTQREVEAWLSSTDFSRLAPLAQTASAVVWASDAMPEVKAGVTTALVFAFGECVLPPDLDVNAIRSIGNGLSDEYQTAVAEPLYQLQPDMFSRYSCYWNTQTLDECNSCCDRTATLGGMGCVPIFGPAACGGGAAVGWLFCLYLCSLAN